MKYYCNEETCPNRTKGCAFCTVLMDIKDCPMRLIGKVVSLNDGRKGKVNGLFGNGDYQLASGHGGQITYFKAADIDKILS